MIKEFKEFIARGNVLDLAVAVIIGAAFGKIVTSFVEDLLMPLIGVFGQVDFNNLVVKLGTGESAPVLKYGSFITNIINFLIIAFALFLVVKAMNKVQKPAAAPATKDCPRCLTAVPEAATRCPACTSDL